MGPLEQAAAVAFAFALLINFAGRREAHAEPAQLRLFLLANAGISGAIFAATSGQSLRSSLLHGLVALGATEAAYWGALGIASILPRDMEKPWNFKHDPIGCALSIALVLALLLVFPTGGDE